MAKYDWTKLKREYLTGEYKSIAEFLREKGMTRTGFVNKQTSGWDKERATLQQEKSKKILESVTEKQIEHEIDRNAAHLAAGDLIVTKLLLTLQGIKPKDKNSAYLLNAAANALATVQKVQQLGDGVGVGSEVSIIDDL